jgi:hypothetical protein
MMDTSLTTPRCVRAGSAAVLAIVVLAAVSGIVGSRTSIVTAQAGTELQGLAP